MRDALAEAALVADLAELDAVPADLVAVGRPDPAAGGAEPLASAFALVEAVQGDVVREDEVRAV